ncbi:redox-sensitive transcriptional activator SoxR [Vibrio mangrovi]|nr:Redox-sensitive transcriptional activator SoxR [Vibrio mangrovi]
MDKSGTLSVGELAKRSGVAVSALHFYEAKGLISATRTHGNQRRYERSVLRRIAIIRIAQRAGLSLAELKQYFDKVPEKHISAADWGHLGQEWHDMLSERINMLLQLRDQIGECIGCGCLSLKDCPLRNPDDVMGKKGTGAQRLIQKAEQAKSE